MIILRQKEFNLISDVKHSGIKRTFKKNVGRIRVNLSNRLKRAAEKEANKGGKYFLISRAWHTKTPHNPRVLKNLEEFAKKNNTDIIISKAGEAAAYTPKQAETFVKVFKNAPTLDEATKSILSTNASKKRNTVFVPEHSPVNIVAHEVGHTQNSNKAMSKHPGLVGWISRRVMNENTLQHNLTPIGDRSILTSLLTNLEERNASRNGIRLLKKAGANREELKDAKDFYKVGLASYRHGARANTLAKASKKVALPGGTSTRHLIYGA